MSAAPQVDWFKQNAPTAPAPKQGGDWFAENAPQVSAKPKEEKGFWGKLWEKVNTPTADFILPDGVTTADILKGVAFKQLGLGEYMPGVNDENTVSLKQGPGKAALQKFVRGAVADTASTAAGFTSPLSVATIGTGAATKIPGAIGTLAKAATGTAAAGFGGKGALDIAGAGTETTPEAWQQRLQGGAMVAGGAAGVGVAARPLVAAMRGAPGEAFTKITGAFRKPEVAASVVKEAMALPPLAVSGIEDLFRAAAPTGKKFSFRSTGYSAAGDLNEIGATLDLKKFRGGIANPDMRGRATVNAMNEHLSKMYKEERAPQIQRLAKNPVKITIGADAAEGMSFLEKNAAKAADRALVQEAQKASTLPVEKLDVLERLVSDELAPYRKMTPQERAAAGVTNPKYAGLKALHDELRGALNGELTRNGEVGLAKYERRYSAVSEFRNQLRDRVNALELERTIPGERIARSLVGGKSGVASASQAAVADANIGRLLEAGFDRLRTSGVKPDRGTATPRSAGSALALRTQPTRVIPMGSRTAPIEPPNPFIPRIHGAPYER